MRRELRAAAARLALPTLALVFVLVFKPGQAALALRIYALLVAGYALVVALAGLRRALPAARPLRTRERPMARPHPPETLERIEQEMILGISSAFDLHYHLSPRLRSLARDLLAGRRGIPLEDNPESARLAVGDEAWELVRPQRPPPQNRLARGMPASELERVVAALERI